MSYASDKAIFLRHYEKKNPDASEAATAWEAYYIARRVESLAESVAAARASYEAEETKLGREPVPSYRPNPDRRELGGGFPHERVVESVLEQRATGGYVGVLLEDRNDRQAIEITAAGHGRLYRLGSGSPLIRLATHGRWSKARLGFLELEAVLLYFADDPDGFQRLAAIDKGVDSMPCDPRDAVRARWGTEAERLLRAL